MTKIPRKLKWLLKNVKSSRLYNIEEREWGIAISYNGNLRIDPRTINAKSTESDFPLAFKAEEELKSEIP